MSKVDNVTRALTIVGNKNPDMSFVEIKKMVYEYMNTVVRRRESDYNFIIACIHLSKEFNLSTNDIVELDEIFELYKDAIVEDFKEDFIPVERKVR